MRILGYLLTFLGLIAVIIIVRQYQLLPAAETSVLIAAFLPLLGVLMTLDLSNRHFERRLREDRDKEWDRRKFDAKQKVLLEAADAVLRAVYYISALPEKELSADGTIAEEIPNVGLALNRLHFYCSVETIEGAISLARAMMEIFTELMVERMPSLLLAGSIKQTVSEIAVLQKQLDQLYQQHLLLLTNNPNHPMIATFGRTITEIRQRIAGLEAVKAGQKQKEFLEKQKCRDLLMAKQQVLFTSSADLLIMARRELGFPINEAVYKKLMDEQIRLAGAKSKELVAAIRARIDAARSATAEGEPSRPPGPGVS